MKSDAINTAVEIVRAVHVAEPSNLSMIQKIRLFVEGRQGVKVRLYKSPSMQGDLMAVSLQKKDEVQIIIPASLNSEWARFAMLKELAHLLIDDQKTSNIKMTRAKDLSESLFQTSEDAMLDLCVALGFLVYDKLMGGPTERDMGLFQQSAPNFREIIDELTTKISAIVKTTDKSDQISVRLNKPLHMK